MKRAARADGDARGRDRADRRGEGAARREGLRPGDGRAAAAPRDPALHRGPARRLRARPRARARARRSSSTARTRTRSTSRSSRAEVTPEKVTVPPEPVDSAERPDDDDRARAASSARARCSRASDDAAASGPRWPVALGDRRSRAILFRAAHVSPSTGAFYRCALALPVLGRLSWLEDRRYGPRPLKQRALAWLAGRVLRDRPGRLARGDRAGRRRPGDRARQPAGRASSACSPGRSCGERPSNRSLAAIPVALVGVLLISGVLESGAYGKNPGARRRLRDPDRARVLGLPARPARRESRTSGGRPGRCSTRRLVSALACIADRPGDREPRLDAGLAGVGLPAAARAGARRRSAGC